MGSYSWSRQQLAVIGAVLYLGFLISKMGRDLTLLVLQKLKGKPLHWPGSWPGSLLGDQTSPTVSSLRFSETLSSRVSALFVKGSENIRSFPGKPYCGSQSPRWPRSASQMLSVSAPSRFGPLSCVTPAVHPELSKLLFIPQKQALCASLWLPACGHSQVLHQALWKPWNPALSSPFQLQAKAETNSPGYTLPSDFNPFFDIWDSCLEILTGQLEAGKGLLPGGRSHRFQLQGAESHQWVGLVGGIQKESRQTDLKVIRLYAGFLGRNVMEREGTEGGPAGGQPWS